MSKKFFSYLIKILFTFLYAMIVIAVIKLGYDAIVKATVYAFDYTKALFTGSTKQERGSKEVELVIPKGATTSKIAEILKEKDLVENADWFRLQSILSNNDGLYKPGTYTLNINMSDDEIMDVLIAGVKDDIEQVSFTIIEGETVSQIARKLESSGIVTASEFITCVDNEAFDYDFINEIPSRNGARLEGYIFPDTYFFYKDSTAKEIVSKILARFDQIYTKELRDKAALMGLSADMVVTIAAIIEKEVNVPEERGLASAVIYNRLSSNMKLEMCSTIMFALGKNKARLLNSDLEVESPYNTYRYSGLPAGPICNPGEASIKAALNPEQVDYLYFVLKDEKTGEHVFTADYDEFLNAKQKYNQRF